MNIKRALLIAAALVIVGVVIVAVASKDVEDPVVDWGDTVPQGCTMEAMICPDGTAVGRTGPNCAFAPCPQATTTKTEDEPAPVTPGGAELDMGIGDASEPTPKGKACIREGGSWDPQYEECVGVRPAQCEAIGGIFNECASACRHNPEAEICTLQCVQVCHLR
jgi:hypothetical protein